MRPQYLLHATLCCIMLALTWARGHATVMPDSTQIERLHLTADRRCYEAGQRAWVRVFMVNATSHIPITQSQYAYVELLDDSALALARVMLKADGDIYCGHIDLPANIPAGNYWLRTYTMAIAGIKSLESIVPITIGGASATRATASPPPAYSPVITTREDGDSTLVIVDLGEECSTQVASMALSVTVDSLAGQGFNISRSLARPCSSTLRLRTSPETSQSITGTVTGTDYPVTVSLIAPQENFVLATRTGSDGRFAFTGLEFADSTVLIMQATRLRGVKPLSLSVDSRSFPTCTYLNRLDDPDEPDDDLPDYDFDDNSILLKGITVTARYNDMSDRDPVSMLADQSFSLEEIKRYDPSTLRDLFRRIAGLSFAANGRFIMRGHHSIYGENYGAVAIDGVIVGPEYDYENIPIGDVVRVDVYKGGSAAIWGLDGGSGVIAITTKRGQEITSVNYNSNIVKAFPFGFQEHRPFTPDAQTLYWNPAIKTCGNRMFNFKVPAVPGSHVIIEGITQDGQTIYCNTRL